MSMAHNYTIELNYKATITVNVEGDFPDEGVALDKAREIAEDSDIKDFTLGHELESKIVNVR